MFTFETESLGQKVKSSRSFATWDHALDAAIAWMKVCHENDEDVAIKIVRIKSHDNR